MDKMNEFYEYYQKRLADCIFERAKEEISKEKCNILAKNYANHKKYRKFQNEKTLEEEADALIEAYFS